MPYVNKESRFSPLAEEIFNDLMSGVHSEGDLNYFITNMLIHYAKKKGVSYATFNSIIGALECAKLEFYRRAIAPYEEMKIKENGDVY